MLSAFRLTAAAAVLAAGAAVFASVATAAADPAPGCTAADVASVETGVAGAMAGYLFTHPDVNGFFSSIQGLSKDDAFNQATAYFKANPGVLAEMDAIRAPAKDLRARCNIPVSSIIRGVL